MTPTRLTACLTTMHWSTLRLAKITGWSEGAVRQWLAGAVRIPSDVAAWLEKVARFVERNPPPERATKISVRSEGDTVMCATDTENRYS